MTDWQKKKLVRCVRRITKSDY